MTQEISIYQVGGGGRLGGCSVRGRWPHRSPWSTHIYLVLCLAPYWIVALLTHLYTIGAIITHCPINLQSTLPGGLLHTQAARVVFRRQNSLISCLGDSESLVSVVKRTPKCTLENQILLYRNEESADQSRYSKICGWLYQSILMFVFKWDAGWWLATILLPFLVVWIKLSQMFYKVLTFVPSEFWFPLHRITK